MPISRAKGLIVPVVCNEFLHSLLSSPKNNPAILLRKALYPLCCTPILGLRVALIRQFHKIFSVRKKCRDRAIWRIWCVFGRWDLLLLQNLLLHWRWILRRVIVVNSSHVGLWQRPYMTHSFSSALYDIFPEVIFKRLRCWKISWFKFTLIFKTSWTLSSLLYVSFWPSTGGSVF